MVFKVIDWSDYDNQTITPFAMEGMRWVTNDFMDLDQPVRDAEGKYIYDKVDVEAADGKIEQRERVRYQRVGCIESMARRVIGALCYVALAVAVEIELVVRAVVTLFLIPLSFAHACLFDNYDFDDTTFLLDLLFIKDLGLIVDLPVRAISGIVQKCLLDLNNENENPKDFEELTLCSCKGLETEAS
ncbi:MAG: hypothetical protein HYX48_02485 [Chlamydiales bacterium]|nr:hypothetical protein [Chlamydiales bacterium]